VDGHHAEVRLWFADPGYLGKKHLARMMAMGDLANTLGKQGQLDKVAKMRKEVLEKRRRILGEEHPATVSAIQNLAYTLQRARPAR
jgi:hypothetical protein